MIDELLNQLPAVICNKKTGKQSWFTLGSGTTPGGLMFWQAAYLDEEGEPVGAFYGKGNTPAEAVQTLIDTIKLAELWARPAVPVDELTGQLYPESSEPL